MTGNMTESATQDATGKRHSAPYRQSHQEHPQAKPYPLLDLAVCADENGTMIGILPDGKA